MSPTSPPTPRAGARWCCLSAIICISMAAPNYCRKTTPCRNRTDRTSTSGFAIATAGWRIASRGGTGASRLGANGRRGIVQPIRFGSRLATGRVAAPGSIRAPSGDVVVLGGEGCQTWPSGGPRPRAGTRPREFRRPSARCRHRSSNASIGDFAEPSHETSSHKPSTVARSVQGAPCRS